jgi:hypothetical protein
VAEALAHRDVARRQLHAALERLDGLVQLLQALIVGGELVKLGQGLLEAPLAEVDLSQLGVGDAVVGQQALDLLQGGRRTDQVAGRGVGLGQLALQLAGRKGLGKAVVGLGAVPVTRMASQRRSSSIARSVWPSAV